MNSETLAASARLARWKWWPEVLIAVLACAVFLGFLGSVDLWGKREQRAAVEAIDTIDHRHWLVAEILGRPRLEKPPLPRWCIAALFWATGCRDEWMLRLPSAICGLATIALVRALGGRMAGESVGRASALVLCSTAFFVSEMRQAGNDAPLAFFTTLALYGAWRRLHDEEKPAWSLVFHAALGLGVMTKGPVILQFVFIALIPYLALSGRLASGMRRLATGWGLCLFLLLTLLWPTLVLRDDPQALRVWLLEMAEKTGVSRILVHRPHELLAGQWPAIVLPWTPITAIAVVLPFFTGIKGSGCGRTTQSPRAKGTWTSPYWFPWWWAAGNLTVVSLWMVTKPSYYLPAMPATALLTGATWVHLARAARNRGGAGAVARAILQLQWVLLFVAAGVAPLVARHFIARSIWTVTLAIALALATSIALSAWAWRRGADLIALASISAACVFGIVTAYGYIAPTENARRGHRSLAQSLHQLVRPGTHNIMFFKEIDEGLAFYVKNLDLMPVPGTHPQYNTAYDLAAGFLAGSRGLTLSDLVTLREAHEMKSLSDWLDHAEPNTRYLLIRKNLLDRYAALLAGRVSPLLSESGMKRNELVLLRVVGNPITAELKEPVRR
jgi:4-amino-4-deoxy-L-arabinose transferase-like glycosyltransferase